MVDSTSWMLFTLSWASTAPASCFSLLISILSPSLGHSEALEFVRGCSLYFRRDSLTLFGSLECFILMICRRPISHYHDLFWAIQVSQRARSMSVFTLGLNCCEWGELLTSAHSENSWHLNVYLTAWMIIRITRYTVITVARLHTPEHTNTKMHTLCRLPSSSQQWLPPLDSSMTRPELATRGSVMLVTWAMWSVKCYKETGLSWCSPASPTHFVVTKVFLTLKIECVHKAECLSLTQLYCGVGPWIMRWVNFWLSITFELACVHWCGENAWVLGDITVDAQMNREESNDHLCWLPLSRVRNVRCDWMLDLGVRVQCCYLSYSLSRPGNTKRRQKL